MARADDTELIDAFEEFYRSYYRNEIGELAQKYPTEQKSLYIDWRDLYQFDPHLADDFRSKPEQIRQYAEEALRLYDLPVDVSLGQAHVRVRGLPERTDIREIRADHRGMLIAIQGIVRKATDVRPKIVTSAFECQRCGTLTRIPQEGGDFQEPHECQGCERQGPFRINYDQSEFIDAQKLRIQESPEGLRGGETPQNVDVNIEDDITGRVTAGDHVEVTGILKLDQQGNEREKSPMFDFYMNGMTVEIEDEQFEEMDITDEDKKQIIELSNEPDIYEKMEKSIAPSIYGYEKEKRAMIFQLFSGVTKHLPDGSRTRGDLHMLLIGDPGTGKSQMLQYVREIAPRSVYTSGKGSSSAGLCVTGDTLIHTEDGYVPIQTLAEREHPTPVDTDTAAPFEERLCTFDRESGDIVEKESSHVWRMPEKECRRIETEYGKQLEASQNTPLLVCGTEGIEWKPLSQIEPGDHVAVPKYDTVSRTSPPVDSYIEYTTEKRKPTDESVSFLRNELCEEFGTLRDAADELGLSEDFIYNSLAHRHLPQEKFDRILDAIDADRNDIDIARAMLRHGNSVAIPERFDSDLLYLVGLVFGDGDIMVSRRGNNRGCVRISNSDTELLEEAARIIENTFDYSVSIEHQDEKVPCIRIHSATIARLFENLGMVTPKETLELDHRLTTAENADAFLQGLFDADGAVCARDDGGSSIQLSTISPELARQVQLMLASYGVSARSRKRDRRGKTELQCGYEIHSQSVQTHLTIYGADIATFAETIGFRSGRKQRALERLIERSNLRGASIPIGETLARTDGAGGRFYNNVTDGDNPGRERARDILTEVDLGDQEGTVEEVVESGLLWESVVSVERTGTKEVFDLTVPGTHNFIGNGLVTHNTAAAVRDDFGDGQQWSLEAGALVLADQGIAAVDELDKMRSEDQSAMHEALEQQSISVSKAGINATLKSRCSLLGAANPTYGRFDQYEPIGEQIDLDPPLISRFDLIFTVTDNPNEEKDAELADHIIKTNYAGELNTHREKMQNSDYTVEEVERVTEDVSPEIDAELLRKYIAYAKRNCYPTMTEEAKSQIREFYVNLRSTGSDEDAPVPVTARKLEALVRLAEASARVRLSDTVELEDALRGTEIAQYCLEEIGMDPETGEFDADVVETGTTKSQRDRIKNIKHLIADIEAEYDEGAPFEIVVERAEEVGIDSTKTEHEIEKLKQKGEVYEPQTGYLRTT